MSKNSRKNQAKKNNRSNSTGNISSRKTKVTIEVVDGIETRVSIVNGQRLTNSAEMACKNDIDIIELAASKAYRDYMRGKPGEVASAWRDDLMQEARLGAIIGIDKAMKDEGITDSYLIDPMVDVYHSKAYYYAKMRLMTEGRRIRTGITLSERAVRQFNHAREFLAKHPDGKWTAKELEELAKKMWLKSPEAVKKVLADYIEYSRQTVVSMEDERPGFERSVTWEETTEAPVSEEDIADKEDQIKQGFLHKMFWEATTLSKKQKTILVQYLGLFGTEKVKLSDLAKANNMALHELSNAIPEYVSLLRKYIVDECGYESLEDVLAQG